MKRQPIAVLTLAAALAAHPGVLLAADLVAAYQAAQKVDPGMLGAEEAVLAGREKAVQGRALLRPQVSLSGSLSYVSDHTSTQLPALFSSLIKSSSSGVVHQAAAQVAQPLYNAGLAADRRQLEEQTSLAEIQYAGARQDLIERVAQVYFGVLLARENLRVVRSEKAAVQWQLDRARARYEAGRDRITDLQHAQAQFDRSVAREIAAASDLELRESQYREVTGAQPRELSDLRRDFAPRPPVPDSLAQWQSRAEDGNTRVRSRIAERTVAEAEIDKYRLSSRPTVDLVASITGKGQNGGLSPVVAPDNSRMAVVGVQLSIPLYTGGRLDSRLRESEARRRQADHEVALARRDARLKIQDAYQSIKSGGARVTALEQALNSARTSLEATLLGRDVGTRTTLDVLEVQQRMFATELDLAQARYEHLQGHIRLAAAAGALDESGLRAVNAQLAR